MSELPRQSSSALTVAELIEKLREYPADQLVLVDGYKYGCEDPKLREVKVAYRPSNQWWSGDYEEAERDDGVMALVIG